MRLDTETLRPTRAEIDLDSLAANIEAIMGAIPPNTGLMPVVKADAYGHGALECVAVAESMGIRNFAVATLEEAMELRRGGIGSELLVLGPLLPNQFAEALGLDITLTMIDGEYVRNLSAAATSEGRKAKVHVKVDTGMSRVGFPWDADVREILEAARLPGIEVEGIFTHFATADTADKSYALKQYARFADVTEKLEAAGLSFAVKHCSNSGTILDLPWMSLDMVRPGIILYGLYPSDEVGRSIKLRPVMRWTTKVTRVREWPAGTPVSYGSRYVTKGRETLATIPVGYADGYSRMLSHKAEVLIHGTRCPVVGTICMDQCMVRLPDAIASQVCIGDEVELIGRQGNEEISAEELAGLLGTICYEVVCMVDKRVPRVFVRGGRVTGARTLGT